jgi:hypothetical protein
MIEQLLRVISPKPILLESTQVDATEFSRGEHLSKSLQPDDLIFVNTSNVLFEIMCIVVNIEDDHMALLLKNQ